MGIASETKQHNVNMAQQTAVEWLVEKLYEQGHFYYVQQTELIEKAKQMEKEQIMKAVDRGFDKGCNLREDKLKNAEQYYNETFGKS